MKKFKALVLGVAALLCCVSAKAEMYPKTFMVYEVNETNNILSLIDAEGYIWDEKGIEDWCKGEVAAAIMDDNGTPEIFDDSIVDLRYGGDFWWMEV